MSLHASIIKIKEQETVELTELTAQFLSGGGKIQQVKGKKLREWKSFTRIHPMGRAYATVLMSEPSHPVKSTIG